MNKPETDLIEEPETNIDENYYNEVILESARELPAFQEYLKDQQRNDI